MLHFYDPPEEKDEEVAQILGHPVKQSQTKATMAENLNLASGTCRPTGMVDEQEGWEVEEGWGHQSRNDLCRKDRKEQQLEEKQETICDGNWDVVTEGNDCLLDIYRDWEDD